jgi:hypothetical protein
MRLYAKKKEYLLNEHRLTHIQNKQDTILHQEKDLFDVSGMKYVKP